MFLIIDSGKLIYLSCSLTKRSHTPSDAAAVAAMEREAFDGRLLRNVKFTHMYIYFS